jgi:hypothetical protein
MGCRLHHVWLGYKVWRELERKALAETYGDSEPVLFEDVLPFIEQMPDQVVAQVHDYCPPQRKPGFGALIFAAVFLFSGLLFAGRLLGEVVPMVMETLVTSPGELLLNALILVGLWWLAGYLFRQAKRLHGFLSMLCWLGREAELAARP